MTDLTVNVSAPGARQAGADVRSLADSLAVLARGQGSVSEVTAKASAAMKNLGRAAQEAKANISKLQEEAKKSSDGHGGHGGIGALFPRGFEAAGQRIGNAIGLGNIGGPQMAGIIAGMPLLYMYMETLGERARILADHEKDLAVARINGIRAAREAREAESRQGLSAAERNQSAFMSLAGTGGEAGVFAGKQAERSGIPGMVEATAQAYRMFSTKELRDRAIGIAQQGAMLGFGNADALMGKLTPYSLDGVSDDMILRQLGSVNGLPISQQTLDTRRANIAGSSTAKMYADLFAVKGATTSAETSRIGGAVGEAKTDLMKTILPGWKSLSDLQKEHELERAKLESEQASYEKDSRSSFFGGLYADISHAKQIYMGNSPLQRMERLDATYSTQTDASVRQMAEAAAQVSAAMSVFSSALSSRQGTRSPQATP